jgi:hypothetical protein
MIPNNNLSILPFYNSLQKQNHRKDYAFNKIYPLFTPNQTILPFQILREHSEDSLSSAILKNRYGDTVADITAQLVSNGLAINSYEGYGYDVIVYPGILALTTVTSEGLYYLELSDTSNTWYSDMFTMVNTINDCLKIAYKNGDTLIFDTGIVDFENAFAFNLYLPTQLGRPEYPFEEQLEKRDGFQFIEKQISEKTFRFNFLAPEYLLDAMRIIRMMDYIEITNKGDVYTVDQFLITPKWEKGGLLASVEAEFQCNTVIKKIGKSSGVGTYDFNEDFNEDFNA